MQPTTARDWNPAVSIRAQLNSEIAECWFQSTRLVARLGLSTARGVRHVSAETGRWTPTADRRALLKPGFRAIPLIGLRSPEFSSTKRLALRQSILQKRQANPSCVCTLGRRSIDRGPPSRES